MLRINVCDSLIWILNEYKCIVINTDYCESLSHTIWLQETLKKKGIFNAEICRTCAKYITIRHTDHQEEGAELFMCFEVSYRPNEDE